MFCYQFKRALATIKNQRRIERVGAHWAAERDMKFFAGKGLRYVQEGDKVGIDKFDKSKINFLNLMSLIIQS